MSPDWSRFPDVLSGATTALFIVGYTGIRPNRLLCYAMWVLTVVSWELLKK